ncbi:MAG: DUF177 domain-containing protein [Xanthobacteraceae bacterium]|nr:MAG: DUF177 domain-containing protein [Xanthobacteraceae bacterium]
MTRHPIPDTPWSVPVAVDDIPEAGLKLRLTPDEAVRAALARLAGVRAVPALAADFTLTRLSGGRVAVSGRVTGAAGQTCVVSLEPMESPVDEAVDLIFAPATPEDAGHRRARAEGGDEEAGEEMSPDAPETFEHGRLDLGAIATEFLVLGINTYPRKSDAVFEPPAADADASGHPFAALAALKKAKPPRDGST